MKGSIPGTSPSLILYFSLGSLAPPAITILRYHLLKSLCTVKNINTKSCSFTIFNAIERKFLRLDFVDIQHILVDN